MSLTLVSHVVHQVYPLLTFQASLADELNEGRKLEET